MKILVTGGAGFIGSHLVDKLIEKGNEVIIIDNLVVGKKEFINSKAKFFQEDICNFEGINKIFEKEKPEIVFHLAANSILRKSLDNELWDAQNNILGTISILKACKENNVKKIIYTSTGGARVGEAEYLPINEKHPINPCSPYGISKHTAEHYVWMFNKLYGLDYIIFCFGNVYGPRDLPSSQRIIPLFMDLMIKNKSPNVYGDGNQTRDYLFVEDLINFILNSMNKSPKNRLFHLATGKPTNVNEIIDLLKKETNFKGEVNYIGSITGEVKDNVLDSSLAKKELGWNPHTSLNEGIKKTVNWYNSFLSK